MAIGQRLRSIVPTNRDATAEGFEVEVSYDGAQALEAARKFRPDVAIMDLSAPRTDGALDAMGINAWHAWRSRKRGGRGGSDEAGRVRARRLALGRSLALLFALPALLGAAPGRGQAAEPDPAARRIRAFYDALLDAMKQGSRLGVDGRYERLAPVVRATFDLPAMTRIAVGADWNAIAPELQRQLIEAFSRMTIATYASRFDAYSGERFDVEPASEQRSTGRVVRTKLVPSSGEPVMLDYLMRGSGDAWKVVDVYLTGTISELATRRSEFGSILKAGGGPALVESLRQQADRELARGAKGDPGKR